MEPPDPPDREDLSGIEQCRCFTDRVGARDIGAGCIHEPEPGSACLAGDRLRMVAPGVRVACTPPRMRCTWEKSPCWSAPVVWDLFDDA